MAISARSYMPDVCVSGASVSQSINQGMYRVRPRSVSWLASAFIPCWTASTTEPTCSPTS